MKSLDVIASLFRKHSTKKKKNRIQNENFNSGPKEQEIKPETNSFRKSLRKEFKKIGAFRRGSKHKTTSSRIQTFSDFQEASLVNQTYLIPEASKSAPYLSQSEIEYTSNSHNWEKSSIKSKIGTVALEHLNLNNESFNGINYLNNSCRKVSCPEIFVDFKHSNSNLMLHMELNERKNLDSNDDGRVDPFEFWRKHDDNAKQFSRTKKYSNTSTSTPILYNNRRPYSSQSFQPTSPLPFAIDSRRNSNQQIMVIAGSMQKFGTFDDIIQKESKIDESPISNVINLRERFENFQIKPTTNSNFTSYSSNSHVAKFSVGLLNPLSEPASVMAKLFPEKDSIPIPVINLDKESESSSEISENFLNIQIDDQSSSIESINAIVSTKNKLPEENYNDSDNSILSTEMEKDKTILFTEKENKYIHELSSLSAIKLEESLVSEEIEQNIPVEVLVENIDQAPLQEINESKPCDKKLLTKKFTLENQNKPVIPSQSAAAELKGISTSQRLRLRNMLAEQTLKEDAEFDSSGVPIIINFRSNSLNSDELENISYPINVEIQLKDVREEFDILESIGTGKFGHVHKCRRLANENAHSEEFAAKFVKTRKIQRHIDGNIMEVAILCAIGKHPQIASLHATYEYNYECCIITELITGGALYDRIYEDTNLNEQVTVKFVRQMLLGLQHLKRCSVLHRDLKPENLMLVDKTHYRLKIIDFGFSCFYDKNKPPKLLAGTPVYSAPETLNYDCQSFATDLWSVAVIAYEILSGITPFEVPQTKEDVERILDQHEIMTNITLCRYNFNDEGVIDASNEAKSFISSILVKKPDARPDVDSCLKHQWISMPEAKLPKVRRTVSLVRHAPRSQSFRFKHSPLRLNSNGLNEQKNLVLL